MNRLPLPQIWGSTEAKKAATGLFPEPKDADHRVYLAWIRDCDARKCHSLALMDPTIDPLLRARALLFRGELKEARLAIEALAGNPETAGAPDSAELRSDALLEAARLAAYEGDWRLTRELASRALDSGTLEPVSYLSCLQVRALASFELDRLIDAKFDLVSAESLGGVFPHSISWHYARILGARLAGRDEGLSVGLSQLDRLWRETMTSANGATAEQAHALVFGEIDLWRYERLRSRKDGNESETEHHSQGQTHLSDPLENLTLASWAMTERMGERLYAALACLDVATCGPRIWREPFRRKAEAARAEFRRVDRAYSAIFGTANAQSAPRDADLGKSPDAPCATHIVDLRREHAFQLHPWRAIRLEGQGRALLAFRALSRGPLEKARFFSSTWGIAKYSSRLHDSSISNLLSRIRKLTGVPVRIRAGIVEPPTELLIL